MLQEPLGEGLLVFVRVGKVGEAGDTFGGLHQFSGRLREVHVPHEALERDDRDRDRNDDDCPDRQQSQEEKAAHYVNDGIE